MVYNGGAVPLCYLSLCIKRLTSGTARREIVCFMFYILDKDQRGRTSQGSSRIVAIENVDCSKSICSADVVLISSLSEGQIYK